MKYITIIICGLLFLAPSAFAVDPNTPAVNTIATNCANGSPMVFNTNWQCNASTTVAGLPTCTSAIEGTEFVVTNALTPVALAAAVGGGAVHVKVVCLNTLWIVQ